MNLNYIDSLDIPELAKKVEGRIEDIINLLDGILNKAAPQNSDALDTIEAISYLCDKITEQYEYAKSALNELQQS